MSVVDPLVIEWIDSMSTVPAFVRNTRFDVLASNRLARALTASFSVGINLARATFFDPNAKEWLPNWQDVSDYVVSVLQGEGETAGAGESMRKLVGELSARSSQFSMAWARDAVPPDHASTVVMDHPQVGAVELGFQHLQLPEQSDQMLVLAHARPGSVSEARLFRLAALSEQDEDDLR